MPTAVPEKTEHLFAYEFRTITIMICDAALPTEIFSCSVGVFFRKMVSLKTVELHYLISLLEIVKDEEEDSDISVCLCVCDNECLK